MATIVWIMPLCQESQDQSPTSIFETEERPSLSLIKLSVKHQAMHATQADGVTEHGHAREGWGASVIVISNVDASTPRSA